MQTGAASADTLFGAMEKAYVTNPTLNAARAGQRATDELVPQALSGWRPTVAVQGEVDKTDIRRWAWIVDGRRSFASLRQRPVRIGDLAIQLNQPLFRGFGTVEPAPRPPRPGSMPASRTCCGTEQQVLFDVVQAYMDVYAGRQFVVLRRQDVAALQAQVQAHRATASRWARSPAPTWRRPRPAWPSRRMPWSMSQTELAQAVATYVQVVGNEPGKLSYPKVVKHSEVAEGGTRHRGRDQSAASGAGLRRGGGQQRHQGGLLGPSAQCRPAWRMALTADPDLQRGQDRHPLCQIGAQLSIPIYEGGLRLFAGAPGQAAGEPEPHPGDRGGARRAPGRGRVVECLCGPCARSSRTPARRCSAAQLALNGVQQEYQAGTRTTLDVLDAQRDLVQAQVLQVTAERNRVVSGYQLLAAIGHLTARDVGLKVPLYDPEENYRRVRNKWIGTDVKTVE